jgi:2-polyprenyl-6-methoxyphenol hydroxylase-like FAD-dependent oxidoreductase
MTFHRGQGGNNALRDAERFVSAMVEVKDGSKTLKESVDIYDEDVRRRGVQEVEVSTTQTHATHVSPLNLSNGQQKTNTHPL